MSTEHSTGAATPGPWVAEPMYGDFYVLAAAGGMVADHHQDSSPPDSIARMRGVGRGRSPEERRANAFLIAASPDLRAACEAWLEHYDATAVFAIEPDRPWISAMRAAVAKSYGLRPCDDPALVPEVLKAQPQCVHGDNANSGPEFCTCPAHPESMVIRRRHVNAVRGGQWYTYVCDGYLEEERGRGE